MLFGWDCLAVAGFDLLIYALSQIDHICDSGTRCFRKIQELALSRMPYDPDLPV